ncbi:hypothetical protein BVI1335_2130029 [Burkholderia vietnamiensis]|nr:hypothetical protein BVI1335_2130029 [Burkholderia vietnamiensis]
MSAVPFTDRRLLNRLDIPLYDRVPSHT